MGPILPGSRHGYRTTPEALPWIILIAILGGLAFIWVMKLALKDVDTIYENSNMNYTNKFIKD